MNQRKSQLRCKCRLGQYQRKMQTTIPIIPLLKNKMIQAIGINVTRRKFSFFIIDRLEARVFFEDMVGDIRLGTQTKMV